MLFLALFKTLLGLLEQLVERLIFHPQLEPLIPLKISEIPGVKHGTFLQPGATDHFLAGQRRGQTFKGGTFNNPVLIFEVLAILVKLLQFDGQRPLILFDAIAGEHLNVNHRAAGTRRNP